MRRSLYAGFITLGLILGSTGTANAAPAPGYAGSHLRQTEPRGGSGANVFSAKKKIIGPDVSHYQGCSIDWSTVASRRDFAFMKASESDPVKGTYYPDQCFERNWRAVRKLHLPHGAYDFGRPSADPATARMEADDFIRIVKRAGGFKRALPPVLDLEVNDYRISQRQMRRWVRAWIDTIRAHTHRTTVMIYTGQYFWGDNVGRWKPKGALLWGARWGPAPPQVPGWKKVSFWQYTDGKYGPTPHKSPGIGACDNSRWLGTKDELIELTQTP